MESESGVRSRSSIAESDVHSGSPPACARTRTHCARRIPISAPPAATSGPRRAIRLPDRLLPLPPKQVAWMRSISRCICDRCGVAQPDQVAGAERAQQLDHDEAVDAAPACGTRRGPAAAAGRGRGPAGRSPGPGAARPRSAPPPPHTGSRRGHGRERFGRRRRPLAGPTIADRLRQIDQVHVLVGLVLRPTPSATFGAGKRSSMRRGGFEQRRSRPGPPSSAARETAWTVSPQLLTWRTSVPSCGSMRATGSCLPKRVQVDQVLQFRHQSAGGRRDLQQDLLACVARFRASSTSVRSTRWNGRGGVGWSVTLIIVSADSAVMRHRAGQVEELEAHLDAGDLVDARVLGLDVDVGQHRFLPARAGRSAGAARRAG